MPVIGIQITKQDIWEGKSEEFSNVYHYTSDAGSDIVFDGISDSDVETLVDNIVVAEKVLHSNTVDYLRARVYGPTDAPANENTTIAKIDLSGSGDNGPGNGTSLEDTVLVRAKTGRESVRDRSVWLRKWYRTLGRPDNTDHQWSDEVLERKDQLPGECRTFFRNFMEDLLVQNLVELSSFPDRLVLCSPAGRRALVGDDSVVEVYPYLQTHDVKY